MDSLTWTVVFLLLSFILLSTVLLTVLILLPIPFEPASAADHDGDRGTSLPGQRDQVSVQIVVLGDIGRSPRMQYHALSLASRGAYVQLIGYRESDVHPELLDSPFVTVVPLASFPGFLQRGALPFIVAGPLKALHQAANLFDTLAYKTSPSKWMLVQNPPAIPTIAIAQLVCFLRHSKLVIDWHNYGWSILTLKLGSTHPLVRISRVYESFASRGAHAHFAVTEAMSRDLKKTVSGSTLVLHDRPAAHFEPLVESKRLETLSRLEPTAQMASSIASGATKLLVSSTSWTPDEDFSVLLDALVRYSSSARSSLPRLLVVITGKGPQKRFYLDQISSLSSQGKLGRVDIVTAWLTIQDYASLLAAADLGVCLHQSSSGLDLPMKVVDMFGAGLPVLAWSKYESFGELVKEGVNGRGFSSVLELEALLEQTLAQDSSQIQALREGALQESRRRWEAEWAPIAGRLFGVV